VKKNGGKVSKVGTPQKNTDIEYCGKENLGWKIPFMMLSEAFFLHLFVLLDI
jgi:hypothetical protein